MKKNTLLILLLLTQFCFSATAPPDPYAGEDGELLICSSVCTPNANAINLYNIITGEDAGGFWTQISGDGGIFDADAGTFTPTTGATTSTFMYTVGTDTSIATITIVPVYLMGQNITICSDNYNLIDLYALVPDAASGGTWTQTSGSGGNFNSASGTFTPAPGATTSSFAYIVPDNGPCGNVITVVTVNINPAANAGQDGEVTLCSSNFGMAPINLFDIIAGEAAGGVWTRTSGTGGVFNSDAGYYIPSPNSTDSTFLYTVYVVGPCTNDTSTATITIINSGNAGEDGEVTVCSNSMDSISLASLLTGETEGGTWIRSSGTGGVFNAPAGIFTPMSGATTSVFTYTFQGSCGTDSSTVTINIVPAASAGQDGEITICSNNTSTIHLAELITGEISGGTWTMTSGTGGIFNAAEGTFTPTAGATTSTFTYTVSGECGTDTSTATIHINNGNAAGSDGEITICSNNTSTIHLAELITGEISGGTWTMTSGTGGIFNAAEGTFTPTAGATTSTFTYTVSGECGTDTSTTTIHINNGNAAGSDGEISICSNNTSTIHLAELITGEISGGTWTMTSGTGGIFNAAEGTFTPTAGATTSTFTYTVSGECGNDTSTATIHINNGNAAGSDGEISICSNNTSTIHLAELITGEISGGTWTMTSGTGGIFNAAEGTFIPTAGATTSTFTYTVSGECGSDTSTATIHISNGNAAGSDGEITICSNNISTIHLAELITGEISGGTWTMTSGTGGVFDAAEGTFTPTAGATTSTFTYTVSGECGTDTSTATIHINNGNAAGSDGEISICSNNTSTIHLAELITGEISGGIWTMTSGTGGIFNAAEGTFTPTAGATTSTFTYTVSGECGSDTSTATIHINNGNAAGSDGEISICSNNTSTIHLAELITGEISGGTWTMTSGTGGIFNAAEGTFTPTAGATTSTFTYTLSGECGNDTSTATIHINNGNAAGSDGEISICSNNTSTIHLAELITGEISGGSWTMTSGTGGIFNVAEGTFTPSTGATTSTFTYTVSGQCGTDTSTATVTITAAPTATISYSGPFCITENGSPNVIITGTGSYSGGTFTAGSGLAINPTTGAITPSASNPGTYTISYATPVSNGCGPITATTTVTIDACNGGGGEAEGCSLGYWKNHTDRWCDAYSPTMIFGSIFVNAPSQLANLTLLQVLNHGGGGIYNLGRQGVAALLNACNDAINYPEPYGNDPQAVINAVNAAYAAGGNAPGDLASQLDELNTLGCPLSGTPATNRNGFEVYPVVFNETINIRYQYDFETDVTVEFFDATGRLLQTFEDTDVFFDKEATIAIRFLHDEGQLYLMKVTTNQGSVTKKIVSGK